MMTFTENQIREIKRLVSYRGRKVHQREHRSGMSLNSYWDSGSRDYFYYINVASMSVYNTIPQNGTPFDGLNIKSTFLPENVVLVERSVIRGKDSSITIYS